MTSLSGLCYNKKMWSQKRESAAVFRIQPKKGFSFVNFGELWEYRELIYFLTWRDIKVRYKQTIVGVAWAIIQPVLMMTVFTLIFGRLAKIPSDGVPYPLFVYTALLPWQLFSRTISESTNSIVANQRVITRVYFPRIIIPLSTALSAFFDFLIAGSVLFVFMLFYGIFPGLEVFLLPLPLFLLLLTALGAGLWFSALNAEFRDIKYIVPFVIQLWFFLTPVVYPSSFLPQMWRIIYHLNPMVGIIEAFRGALLRTGNFFSSLWGLSSLISIFLFVTGTMWFNYREKKFVDLLGSGG